MKPRTGTRISRLLPGKSFVGRFFSALILLVTAFAPQASAVAPVARAEVEQASASLAPLQDSTITLVVQEYQTASPITEFTYLVNEDNTGDPSDPDPNNHPSLSPMASHSPVVATGDHTTPTLALPDGRYLITVRADGYKLAGKHVKLPDEAGDVVVELVSEPLPLSQIRVHVFHDNHPVNGEDDIPLESGLPGFRIVVGDTAGEVTVDWFGNPICTEYVDFPGGTPIPGTGGACPTDANGDVLIPNLPRGKYEVIAVPPDGAGWIQTTTIEGTHVIDAWIEEGNTGYSPREGFQTAMVWVGFVQEMDWAAPGTGTIMGTVRTTVEWTPPVSPLVLGQPVERPYIAVTDIGANDEQAYLGRGNPDGTFTINNVPAGVYQLVIWDQPLDYIMSFRTVVVADGATVDMGEFGIPRWYGWISGFVFEDANADAIRDPGEAGIGGVDLGTRFRDGSIQYGTFTDSGGYYEFPEVFELEKFAVAEVGFGRFAATGASVHDEYDSSVIKSVHPGALTLAELTWAAKRSIIDWGKQAYSPGENGGISGMVIYATTRNEFNARYALAEDYEPGIPNVTMRLWGLGLDGDPNTLDDILLNEVQSDAWEHPTDCDVLDSNGDPLPDPLGLGPRCIEVPNISNEVKDGVYDGGYAFESYWSPYYEAPGAEEFDGLPPGDYVVEVVVPDRYQIVKEEDLNTAEGNDLVPAIPPPPCVGDLHLADVPDEYGSPYNGQTMPLCDRRLVTLQEGQNAAGDFFLLTDNAVPIPGRIFGFLLDDLNIETDPNFIYYGEKRGVRNTPVGIRDFTGRLITTVHSDENGIFEVLLPSTYVADAPTPSGVPPAMYLVVGNDPGDPDAPNPNYNPNYHSRTFVFDVWPGKTTFADVALFAITAFAEFPGAQFGQPANCELPGDTPKIYAVSQPYGSPGDSFTVSGTGFGSVQGSGQVTINDVELTVTGWLDALVNVTVPPGFATGPGQLLVTTDAGETAPSGLTFHVLGGTYVPTVVTVDPGDSIQAAINAASGDTLIVVNPGTYYENLILHQGVKLQGVGTGTPPVGTGGTVLDGRFFLHYLDQWVALLNSLTFDGNQEVPIGATIVVVAEDAGFGAAFNAQIDGLRITGARGEDGGGIHVNAYARYLEISNNVIQSNGGGFGGALTLGQAYAGDNQNDNIIIHHNRILNNGGISLAGGIGIFNGAANYELAYNDICGNYSAEYGGGISHFGLSPDGSIHHNRIYYNNSFDEGGGILVGGEQPIPPQTLTNGSGEVSIYSNLIQANLANDDGGGVRLLQPLDYTISISNNMIVNNVSTDLGGAIALDDASEINIVNNTIAKNVSTATAEDSDGLAHAAGLVAEPYSTAFADHLGVLAGFPDPVLFNNIFWDNQAYTWDGAALAFDGIMDLEVFGTPTPEFFSPVYSLLSVPYGAGHPSNIVGADPQFVNPYDTTLDAVAFRMEPNFITVIIVTVDLSPELIGDYHITGLSPAIDAGTAASGGVNAPADDFDGDPRPGGDYACRPYDVGADEFPSDYEPCYKTYLPLVFRSG